jgi:hypothetical protein
MVLKFIIAHGGNECYTAFGFTVEVPLKGGGNDFAGGFPG